MPDREKDLPAGYQFGDISRVTRTAVDAGTITDKDALAIMQAAYVDETARLSRLNVIKGERDAE